MTTIITISLPSPELLRKIENAKQKYGNRSSVVVAALNKFFDEEVDPDEVNQLRQRLREMEDKLRQRYGSSDVDVVRECITESEKREEERLNKVFNEEVEWAKNFRPCPGMSDAWEAYVSGRCERIRLQHGLSVSPEMYVDEVSRRLR